MDICIVKGNIVSTNKVDKLTGAKLMVVAPVDMATMKESGASFVAIDTVCAGNDEIVMVVKGSSARQTPETEGKPVDAIIAGIVDSIELNGKMTFKKFGKE